MINNKEKLLFIVGNPRSGTSLLRIMLTCHSKISIPPECGFIQWWYKKYGAWNYNKSSDSDTIYNFVQDLKKSKKIETWNINLDLLAQKIKAELPANYSDLCKQVYLLYSEVYNKNATILGDKNNYYIKYLDLLYKLYPNAYFIHIIRDVRDVACSYLNLKNIKSNSIYFPKLNTKLENIAHEWLLNNNKVLKFFEKNNIKQYCTIKYEDLIINTRNELTTICSLLNIEYEQSMSDYYVKNRAKTIEPLETIDWKKKTLDKPDKSNIMKYKNQLSISEIEIIDNITNKLIRYFNYEQ